MPVISADDVASVEPSAAPPPAAASKKKNWFADNAPPQRLDGDAGQAPVTDAQRFSAPGVERPPLPVALRDKKRGPLGKDEQANLDKEFLGGHSPASVGVEAAAGLDPSGIVPGALHASKGVKRVVASNNGREAAAGVHDVIAGAAEAGTPLLAGGIMKAPLKTAAAVGVGMVSQEAVMAGLRHLGLPDEYATVAGDLAGILAGAKTHANTPELKAKVEPILKQRNNEALAHLLKVEPPGPKREALITEARSKGVEVPELQTREQQVTETLAETSRVDAQFDEAERRLSARRQQQAPNDEALSHLLRVEPRGPKRDALIADARARGVAVPELPTREQESTGALEETSRVDAQFEEAEKRLADRKEEEAKRLAAREQSRRPAKARKAAERPVIPETGIPEGVARAQSEREAIIGKPREQWTNQDLTSADELRAQGYTGASGSARPDPPSVRRPPPPGIVNPAQVRAERQAILDKPEYQWTKEDIETADQLRKEGQIGSTRPSPSYTAPPAAAVAPESRSQRVITFEDPVPAASPPAAAAPPPEVPVAATPPEVVPEATAAATPEPTPATDEETPADAPPEEVPAEDAPAEPAEPEKAADGKKIWTKGDAVPGYDEVVNMKPHDLKSDPARFQYKQDAIGRGGTTDEFRDAKEWDPGLGGAIAVWQDPATGEVHPINGHHRTELAQRTNPPHVNVRFIEAKTATEARTFGAMMNIGEGKGTALDAAKLFRDSHITPEDLAKYKIQPTSKLAVQGMALSKLDPSIYRQVVDGKMTPSRGALIGEFLGDDHDAQKAAVDFFKQSDRRGTRYNDAEAADIIQSVKHAPDQVEQIETLFGVDEVRKNLFGERAQVSASIGRRLGKERSLFALVSKEGNQQRLGLAGNVLNSEGNQKLSHDAARVLSVYDKLKFSSGPVSDALNTAAKEVAEGVDVEDAADRAYEKIRHGVSILLGGATEAVADASEHPGGSGEAPRADEPPETGKKRSTPRVGRKVKGGKRPPPPSLPE